MGFIAGDPFARDGWSEVTELGAVDEDDWKCPVEGESIPGAESVSAGLESNDDMGYVVISGDIRESATQ